jgi:hypothetical protein
MSWIDKELRRRQKADSRKQDKNSVAAPLGPAGAGTAVLSMAELWEKFEDANNALPPELKLIRQSAASANFSPDRAMYLTLFLAANGAGLGFTGSAVRYFWPKKDAKKSNNFWVRYEPAKGYVLSRRLKPSWIRPNVEESSFNPGMVDHIVKCLVTDTRVTWRAISKRRFWFF